MTNPKQLVSTGKVIWIESGGEESSPVRFVLEDDRLYFLRNGKHERLPQLADGQTVRVAGHPLAKQTRSAAARARVEFLAPDDVPRSVLLELAGTFYDPRLSPEQNFERLKPLLEVARLELV